MAIITAAEWKTYAGITAITYDARLAVLIPALQDAVQRWCNRVFDTATFTELHDGVGNGALILKNPPIVSVTSVTIADADNSFTGVTALTSTDYDFSLADDGRLWLVGAQDGRFGMNAEGVPSALSWGNSPAFPRGRENIQVVYVGGYGSSPAAAMPESLKYAMYKLIDTALLQTFQDTSMKSESLGNYSYTRFAPGETAAQGGTFGSDIEMLLAPHRRVPVM